jgi:Flp pilus assembly protein TadB
MTRYRWDPVHPASARRAASELRASDAERNAVADQLSRHFADGRLDQPEFSARLERAMGAVTRGDLDGLFHDLPASADTPVPPRHRRRMLLPVVLLVVLAATVADSIHSTLHVTWLIVAVVAIVVWRRGRRRRHSSPPELPGR